MKRIWILALAASGLTALASVPALAGEGPLLPKGWIRGAETPARMPPPPELGWGSFQSNHEETFRVRSSVPGGPVDLETLPVVEIEPSAAAASPTGALPSGSRGDVV